MHKLLLLACLFLVSLGLGILVFSYIDERGIENLPIEMLAFNSLSNKEEGLIPVSPKDSSVERVPVSDELMSLIQNSYNEQQIYTVTFNQTASTTSGNLVVYVALDDITMVINM